jgi:nitrogen fixation protein FixH
MSSIAEKQFTGRHMLIIMICFFGVVLAANLTMVYFARLSWTGLVVRNSYVASQEFNGKTAAMAKAAEISVHIELEKTQVMLTLRDKNGWPVRAEAATLTLGRPSHEGEDQAITLAAQDPGVFTARHSLSHGQWSGSITADIPGQVNWSRPVYLLVKD